MAELHATEPARPQFGGLVPGLEVGEIAEASERFVSSFQASELAHSGAVAIGTDASAEAPLPATEF